jgi:DNA damage-binding protein 1
MDHEIACLDIAPANDTFVTNVCAVGLWTDLTIRLLSLPELESLKTEYLGGDYIARSVLLVSLEGQPYLFCGLGNKVASDDA